MNEIQKKLLLDKVFEPQNLPVLRKILKVALSSQLDDYDLTTVYTLNFRIDKHELDAFKTIDRERYIIDGYLSNLNHYLGGV